MARYVLGAQKALQAVITDEERERMFRNPEWVMMRKYDGTGGILMPPEGKLPIEMCNLGAARHDPNDPESKPANFGQRVVQYLSDKMKYGRLQWEFPLHGEWVNHPITRRSIEGHYVIWTDLGPGTWQERHNRIAKLFANCWQPGLFELAPYWTSEIDKRAMWELLKQQNEEGVIFQHVQGPYIAGRDPNVRKDKYLSTADVVIYKIKIKEDQPNLLSGSAFVAILNDKEELVEFGTVGIASSTNIDHMEQALAWMQGGGVVIAELQYLYATDKAFYQAHITRLRPDKKGLTLSQAIDHQKDLRLGKRFVNTPPVKAQAALF